MRINSLSIKNFKCFEDLKLEFNPQFNVLIGDNATGKTSILDAASFAVGTYFLGARKATNDSKIELRSLKQSEKRRVLSANDINYKLPFCVETNITLNDKEFNWSRSTDKVTGGSTTYKEASEFIEEASRLCQNMFVEHDSTDLPLVAYYGTERLFNERAQRNSDRRKTAKTDGYDSALDPRSLEERFISWFAQEEDEVLKFNKNKALYNAFVNSISTMVPEWNKIRFSWAHETILGQMDDGTWTSFDMLSSGYKSIVRLAGDIAYRAVKLNPHKGVSAVTDTKGIVLIDELDMHLHPSWQKQIVGLLREAFPKIQFIVTSHSPFVIQSVTNDELIKFNEYQIEEVSENVNLKGLEEIIEDEMDVDEPRRSEKYNIYLSLAEEYFNLVKQNRPEDAEQVTRIKSRLDEIELEFKDDPALVALLKVERKIGKM
ncbi:AAA family ATPase [Vibrio parahaemolyticus]|nr:AAA family ATPase [Vibrio parahaemolyticus]ELB2100208.1 AAA family ATPase [Vibrio parahaemolyticus]ELB2209791.1 AAA family ATPase [Vibrio parahaemolyticus]ELB2291823.1 AAA family ATPase [Vibrio parahaemolyticus]